MISRALVLEVTFLKSVDKPRHRQHNQGGGACDQVARLGPLASFKLKPHQLKRHAQGQLRNEAIERLIIGLYHPRVAQRVQEARGCILLNIEYPAH
jgi:hypothetical protein